MDVAWECEVLNTSCESYRMEEIEKARVLAKGGRDTG